MQPTTTPASKLAITAAAIFPVGGLMILFGDSFFHPTDWTSSHALTVLTVAGTIAAGHLCVEAGKLRRVMATIGFALLFVIGTGLVVVQSVGRQAETTDGKVMSAEAVNAMRAGVLADLTRAQAMRDEAAGKMARECASGYGKRCRGVQATLDVYEAAIKGHQADLAKLKPVPVAPKADKVAKVAELFGADAAKVKPAFMLLEPFLWTLFFELGSVVALGFAMRRELPTVRPTVSEPVKALDWTDVEDLTDDQLEELRKLVAKHRRLNNNQLAALCGVRKGTASKWVTRAVAAGKLSRERVGREVAISATVH